MRVCRGLAMLLAASVISACNLRAPEVTLTLAPIDTDTPTATPVRELPTPTPFLVKSPSPGATEPATPSQEPSATATLPPTATVARPTATPSQTEPPTPTRILPATATPSAAATASVVPATVEPQIVDTAAPESTDKDADTDAIPSQPTFTPLPTLNQTEIAKLLATPEPRPATATDVPTLPPATEVATAPTAVASPNVAPSLSETPLLSTPISQIGAPSATPSPTRPRPTVAVRQDLLPPIVQQPVSQQTTFSISGATALEFDVGLGQIFNIENIQLSGGVRLFLPNPVDPGSFLRTDHEGVLRYQPMGAVGEVEMTYSPFHLGYSAGFEGYEDNKNRIVELDWSADGRQFSFRIDPPPGKDPSAAGVWFWQPEEDAKRDATYQIIRDCVREGYRPCEMVNPSTAWHWKTIDVQWSPRPGSDNILLRLHLTAEGRNALAMAQARRDSSYANNAPEMIRYDYGHWHADGSGIAVSGRRPDGLVIIGAVNSDLSGERIILNGSALGLWLRDAVRLADGRYVALGRPGGPGSGPVALYDQGGNRISEFIGGAAPEAVRWYPDRSAVVVTVEGRQYNVAVEGGLIADVSELARDPRFGAGQPAGLPAPGGVVQGSEYYPGQQLQISVPYLNIRGEPTTSSAAVGGLYEGDHVAIFAGPHENEGYRWWRVQTANNIFGWIAGTIDGAPTMRPA